MHRRTCYVPFADQLVRLVDADVVLVSVETFVDLLGPARIDILLVRAWPAAAAIASAFLVLLSSFVLRCRGTDTIVASTIWPPRAM
jgi:hypothetical protein